MKLSASFLSAAKTFASDKFTSLYLDSLDGAIEIVDGPVPKVRISFRQED